jgi:hypothetical protein
VKLREFWQKLWRRSPHDEENDQSGGDVNEAFTTSYGEATSSWIPSQQDRPRH